MPDVMTLRDVATYLKVHPNTIYRLARSGKIPAFKMGTDWRFHRGAVDEWMQARHHGPVELPEDQILHLAYWMLSEGVSLTIKEDEIATLLDWSHRAVKRGLSALMRKGYLAGMGDELALTPEGIGEVQRRFGRSTAAVAGHESVVTFAQRHRPGSP